MVVLRASVGASAALVLLGCGPQASLDDVYPRNCGIEGPVELFDAEPPTYLNVERAGDHYIIEHLPVSGDQLDHWVVDRCGEQRLLLHAGEMGSPLVFGAAGNYLLSCDE